jgi:hypothetical protein
MIDREETPASAIAWSGDYAHDVMIVMYEL